MVQAIALAVSETVTNAVVHAYDDEDRGQVRVSCHLDGERFIVEVADDGVGIGPPRDSSGIGHGLAMVGALVQRLDIAAGPARRGTAVTMAFGPVPALSAPPGLEMLCGLALETVADVSCVESRPRRCAAPHCRRSRGRSHPDHVDAAVPSAKPGTATWSALRDGGARLVVHDPTVPRSPGGTGERLDLTWWVALPLDKPDGTPAALWGLGGRGGGHPVPPQQVICILADVARGDLARPARRAVLRGRLADARGFVGSGSVSEAVSSTRAVFSPNQALRFLADAGAELTGSLDYEQTLRRVARLAVPELADWCAVYVSGDHGEEKEITSGHADPEVEATLLAIRRRRREHGDSESQLVAETAEARLAADVRGGASSEPSERERQIIERLGPTSYMVVPLIARGRTIGALTFLAAREARHYNERDLAFARTLAGRCALAIDNARLYDAAERSLTLLDTVFATAPVGLGFIDRDLRFVRLNEALAALCGRPVQTCVGRPVEAVFDDRSGDLVAVCQRVLGSDQPVRNHLIHSTSSDPVAAVWNVFAAPVHQPGGELLGVTVVVVDVTERQRLLRAERAARIRADFLARAGALLDESLDYEQTLATVADVAVPDVADWCAVSVLDEVGVLQQVVAAHRDPAQRQLADELNRRLPADPDAEGAAARVVRTGETEFVPEIRDEMLTAAIGDPERLALVRRLGLRSVILAALRARGRTFGTLTIANTANNRVFDRDDVQLAEELARRSGIAIDNARLYTERTHIAQSLQARLLPGTLPEIPYAAVAARYRAAGEFNEVGGDFYDVFRRSVTEWVIVVGDVSGKGPEAAAVTALARYTLRAGGANDIDPAAALRRLNEAMRGDTHGRQFATAALAYVTAADGRLTARIALAGHPPAMIVRQGGRVDTAGEFGPMLALCSDPIFPQTDVVLERGDLMLLYTDGVTEAGPRMAPFGDAGYGELLGSLAGLPPDKVVDAVENAVAELQGQNLRDDIALLAIAPITAAIHRQ